MGLALPSPGCPCSILSVKRWDPRGFSRVAAAFSSYDGDLSLPLGLALGSPIFPSGCEGKLGVALESRGEEWGWWSGRGPQAFPKEKRGWDLSPERGPPSSNKLPLYQHTPAYLGALHHLLS